MRGTWRSPTKNRTVITVTHRLGTAATADHLVVLDQGRVVERGTHDELLARAGVYAALWHNQIRQGD